MSSAHTALREKTIMKIKTNKKINDLLFIISHKLIIGGIILI